ncbi:hypothetical protein CMI38_02450 [Candidatus Pacearchaeota archaeon]|jgi:uncharacterized protein YbjQ (UPF0145 family)|nr:hypothetical protein [Candidatus Pacearchaeota archaeon]|tara:strand:- start:219 stop:545 length:327 start_codon:yes stop_codon:yes gene_type:complete
MKQGIIITNTEAVPGKKVVEILGVVQGSTVRSKHLGRDIAAGFKSIVGGELKGYTEMLAQAREEAYNRMVNGAIEKGADAVINMRFMTSSVTPQAAELLAYGTAVKLG